MNADAKTEVCSTHGDFTSRQWRFGKIEFWTDCPDCAEEKQRAEDEHRRKLAKQAEASRFEKKIASSGIPRRFISARLSGWEEKLPGQKNVAKIAREYIDQFPEILSRGRSAIFVGNVGTGKTHLACALGIELLHKGHSVAYSTVIGAIDRVKATWFGKDGGESEADVMFSLTSPDLLILDEVGVQFGSETERQILFKIFDYRYGDVLPTILISNLPSTKLKDFLGERVSDRLKDDLFGIVGFNWESRR